MSVVIASTLSLSRMRSAARELSQLSDDLKLRESLPD